MPELVGAMRDTEKRGPSLPTGAQGTTGDRDRHRPPGKRQGSINRVRVEAKGGLTDQFPS